MKSSFARGPSARGCVIYTSAALNTNEQPILISPFRGLAPNPCSLSHPSGSSCSVLRPVSTKHPPRPVFHNYTHSLQPLHRVSREPFRPFQVFELDVIPTWPANFIVVYVCKYTSPRYTYSVYRFYRSTSLYTYREVGKGGGAMFIKDQGRSGKPVTEHLTNADKTRCKTPDEGRRGQWSTVRGRYGTLK